MPDLPHMQEHMWLKCNKKPSLPSLLSYRLSKSVRFIYRSRPSVRPSRRPRPLSRLHCWDQLDQTLQIIWVGIRDVHKHNIFFAAPPWGCLPHPQNFGMFNLRRLQASDENSEGAYPTHIRYADFNGGIIFWPPPPWGEWGPF